MKVEESVIEEKTGRVISTDGNEEYTDDADKGYFELCWWCSWVFSDIREKMNLINAEKLHDLIWTLESIKYDSDICIDEKYIADKNDLIP